MTGIVRLWQIGNRQGVIQCEDGRDLRFNDTDVWPYDLPAIHQGQLVRFDVRDGTRTIASDVRCWVQEPLVAALRTSLHTGHLQYEGFEHKANQRVFRYRRMVHGRPAEHFLVCTDLALLAAHRVGLQEGPALCEWILAAALKAGLREPSELSRYVVTADDVRAHQAQRAQPSTARGRKWFRRSTPPPPAEPRPAQP